MRKSCESNERNEKHSDTHRWGNQSADLNSFFSKQCASDIRLSGPMSPTFQADFLLISIVWILDLIFKYISIIWIFNWIFLTPVWALIDTAVPLSNIKIRLKDPFLILLLFFNPYPSICFYWFLEKDAVGKGRERDIVVRNIKQLPPIHNPNRDWTHNLGYVPKLGIIPATFWCIEDTPTNLATQPGQKTLINNHVFDVWLIYKELYLFNVYSLISLEISMHSWNHHHNVCDKHIHYLRILPLPSAFIFCCEKNT